MISHTHIQASFIEDAWFQILWKIYHEDCTYIQKVQRGSFENVSHRKQFPGLSINIKTPAENIVPIIPDGLGVPAPTTLEYINDYFANYLMCKDLEQNEKYTYGNRINKDVNNITQLDHVINILKETPLTNQAIIEIGESDDLLLEDPPCLRLLTFNVIPNESNYTLNVSCFFRSWNLWSGLPTNLGGIELLKQYVAGECNFRNGELHAYSSAAHIYDFEEKFAKLRTYIKECKNESV